MECKATGLIFELLEVPRHSGREVPVPVNLKLSVCCDCGTWLIRKGQQSARVERAVQHLVRARFILWRSTYSVGEGRRPRCIDCQGEYAEEQKRKRRDAEMSAVFSPEELRSSRLDYSAKDRADRVDELLGEDFEGHPTR